MLSVGKRLLPLLLRRHHVQVVRDVDLVARLTLLISAQFGLFVVAGAANVKITDETVEAVLPTGVADADGAARVTTGGAVTAVKGQRVAGKTKRSRR